MLIGLRLLLLCLLASPFLALLFVKTRAYDQSGSSATFGERLPSFLGLLLENLTLAHLASATTLVVVIFLVPYSLVGSSKRLFRLFVTLLLSAFFLPPMMRAVALNNVVGLFGSYSDAIYAIIWSGAYFSGFYLLGILLLKSQKSSSLAIMSLSENYGAARVAFLLRSSWAPAIFLGFIFNSSLLYFSGSELERLMRDYYPIGDLTSNLFNSSLAHAFWFSLLAFVVLAVSHSVLFSARSIVFRILRAKVV